VRHKAELPGEVFWHPGAGARGGQIEEKALEGIDAAVHLAGEPIFNQRWSRQKKELILSSRVEGTRLLARTLANLERRPGVLVVASGIHFYGDRGDQELTEDAGVGSGFLAEVCRDWEAAAEPARQAGVRVVHLRFGIMLSRRGGALAAMLPTFRLGLGCVMGRGTQWWSWVALDDAAGAVLHAISREELRGAVNVVAPKAVTAAQFAATLARVCDRSLFASVPAWAMRMGLGERAEVLMSSTRGVPEKLKRSGYRFVEPELEGAMRAEMGSDRSPKGGH
jgi:uncharacterized protein (TIGR01777 family)